MIRKTSIYSLTVDNLELDHLANLFVSRTGTQLTSQNVSPDGYACVRFRAPGDISAISAVDAALDRHQRTSRATLTTGFGAHQRRVLGICLKEILPT